MKEAKSENLCDKKATIKSNWISVKKAIFWLAVFAGCMVIILLAFQIVENIRGSRAWNSYIAENRHLNLDFNHFVPPPVSDDENFSMISFFKEAFVRNTDKRKKEAPFEYQKQIEDLFNLMANFNKLPKHSSFPVQTTVNDFVDLKEIANGLRKNTVGGKESPITNDAEYVLTCLGTLNDLMENLKKEAEKRKYNRFPIDYSEKNPMEIRLPHLSLLKKLASINQLRTVCFLELKKNNQAFEEIKLGLRLADSLKDEPLLISHLVRIAILNMILHNIREGIVRDSWDESHLTFFANTLTQIDLMREFSIKLDAERMFCLRGIDYLMTPEGFKYICEGPEGSCCCSGPSLNVSMLTYWLIPRGWFYQNSLKICEVIDRRINILNSVIEDRNKSPLSKYFEELSKPLKVSPYTALAQLFLAGTHKPIFSSGITQTGAELLHVACAIERFKIKNGKLPDKIEDLVPSYLPKLPVSIFNAEPFRYNKMNEEEFGIIAQIPDMEVLNACESCIGIALLIDWEMTFPKIKKIKTQYGSNNLFKNMQNARL